LLFSKYGVILRQLDEMHSRNFLWFFRWAQNVYKTVPFYNNLLFRTAKGTVHNRPSKLVTLAIQQWCGTQFKTTVQDLRYSVETYATKLYKSGEISENDRQLISEGKKFFTIV
jgi:hypothetical protein